MSETELGFYKNVLIKVRILEELEEMGSESSNQLYYNFGSDGLNA